MLKELFENNKNIIINTDIDGILSGVILVKALGCKIVGFTNSKEYVWLADGYDNLYSHIYVDMFVTDDRAICIDQHIVAVSDKHHEKIKQSGSKYSPQIDGERIFTNESYKIKYPFGATHYLIAQLESEGITVEIPAIKNIVPNSKITIADLILRADDAMASTVYAYRQNAQYWWNYLKEKAPESKLIFSLEKYLEDMRTSLISEMTAKGIRNNQKNRDSYLKTAVEKIKVETKDYFSKQFKCKSSDGGFHYLTDNDGNMLDNVKKYINDVAEALGVQDIEIPEHYIIHKGKYHGFSGLWL